MPCACVDLCWFGGVLVLVLAFLSSGVGVAVGSTPTLSSLTVGKLVRLLWLLFCVGDAAIMPP